MDLLLTNIEVTRDHSDSNCTAYSLKMECITVLLPLIVSIVKLAAYHARLIKHFQSNFTRSDPESVDAAVKLLQHLPGSVVAQFAESSMRNRFYPESFGVRALTAVVPT